MNKDAEKRVLRMVYNETEFSIVDEAGERPDFILKDTGGLAHNPAPDGFELLRGGIVEQAGFVIKRSGEHVGEGNGFGF